MVRGPSAPYGARRSVMNSLLADAILILHVAFVGFIVGGFFLILLGAWRGWRWIRSPTFRYMHLAAIVFVSLETLFGIACPLTVWEDALRGTAAGSPGFIERWLSHLLFYDLPGWVFTLAYVSFAALIGFLLLSVPPHRAGSK